MVAFNFRKQYIVIGDDNSAARELMYRRKIDIGFNIKNSAHLAAGVFEMIFEPVLRAENHSGAADEMIRDIQ